MASTLPPLFKKRAWNHSASSHLDMNQSLFTIPYLVTKIIILEVTKKKNEKKQKLETKWNVGGGKSFEQVQQYI